MADPRPQLNEGRRLATSQARSWTGTYNVSVDRETAIFYWDTIRALNKNAILARIRDGQRQPAAWTLSSLVFQLERAPTTGMYHVQWAIQFGEKHRFSVVRRALTSLFGQGVHIERTQANQAAWDYCQKDDSRAEGTEPVIHGELVKPGQRSDLKAIHQDVLDGLTFEEIIIKNAAAYRYIKGLQTHIALRDNEHDDHETFVVAIHGPSGSGKTSIVRRSFPDCYMADSVKESWWDLLPPRAVVLIDDYEGGYNYQFLMRLLDRYPVRLGVKGQIVFRRPRIIFITSVHHPDSWYAGRYQDGLERRLLDGQIVDTSEWPTKDRDDPTWTPQAHCPMKWCQVCFDNNEKPIVPRLHTHRMEPEPRRLDPALLEAIDIRSETIEFSDEDEAQSREDSPPPANLLAAIDEDDIIWSSSD